MDKHEHNKLVESGDESPPYLCEVPECDAIARVDPDAPGIHHEAIMEWEHGDAEAHYVCAEHCEQFSDLLRLDRGLDIDTDESDRLLQEWGFVSPGWSEGAHSRAMWAALYPETKRDPRGD